jgi:hypothetical protein
MNHNQATPETWATVNIPIKGASPLICSNPLGIEKRLRARMADLKRQGFAVCGCCGMIIGREG